MAGKGHLATPVERLFRMKKGATFFQWNALLRELATLFAVTDHERYLEHLTAATQSLTGDGWRDANFSGHIHHPYLITALAHVDELVGDSMAPAVREQLRETIASLAAYVFDEVGRERWGSWERAFWNHTIIGYSSLGVAGLALADRSDAAKWFDVAVERSRRFLEVGLTPAGMTREGLGYCGYVFLQLGAFLRLLEQHGRDDCLAPPGSEGAARLDRVPEWYAHEMFPRGSWLQNYNDSHWNPHPALWGFLLTFGHRRPALAAAVWEQLVGERGLATFGGAGRWPSTAEALLFFPDVPIDVDVTGTLDRWFHCPTIGYVSARDQWGDRASVFTFNCGEFPKAGHDQSDNNSFTFIGGGVPLVIDAGMANDREEGSPSSSWGHNLVFIDGRAQHVAGEGAGVSGELLVAVDAGDHVAVVGDAKPSYNRRKWNTVRHAVRSAVFVREPIPYVVTYDDIEKDDRAVHEFEYFVHVPASAASNGDGQGDGVPANPLVVRDPGGAAAGHLHVLCPADVRTTHGPFESISQPFRRHELWRFATTAVNPHFVVLTVPFVDGMAPDYEAEVDVAPAVVNVRLRWAYGVDEIEFPTVAGGTQPTLRTPSTDGRLAPPPTMHRTRVP
jgi:hypothetical protein